MKSSGKKDSVREHGTIYCWKLGSIYMHY
jgi:hypothetical protein